MAQPVTRNLVILLTDIKGFTDRTSHQSRSEMQQLLDRHKEIVLPVLLGRGGALVKTMGDAFLMTFESPTNAVLAGIDVQDALRRYNEGKPAEERINVRVAINQGEVNLIDDDVFGEAVNITARIEAVADAGDVFFTEAVYLSMNKKEVPSSEVGLLQLKGIPEKIRVYRVKRENPVKALDENSVSGPALESRPRPPSAVSARPRRLLRFLVPAAAAVAAAILVARERGVQTSPIAAEHQLTVRVTGSGVFAQMVNVTEGRQGNFVGEMLTPNGRESRRAIFDVLVSSRQGDPDAFDVAYQLDFGGDTSRAPSALKAQGEVALRRGAGLTTVDCGRWRIDLALDASGDRKAGQMPGDAAAGDYQITAALSKGSETLRCAETLRLGAQGNVAQGAPPGASLIFNALPAASAEDGGVDLEFQLEYRPRAGADLLQVQNERTLALGRADRSQLSGYEFDLLAQKAVTPAPSAR